MTNYERSAMRRINGVSRETWAALVADAKNREVDRADAENWIGALCDEGRNNN
jgi:hypothetical protein